MLVGLLIVVFLYLFVIPFVFGFFARGPEWMMYPTMYLNIWLLRVCCFGDVVKTWLIRTWKNEK